MSSVPPPGYIAYGAPQAGGGYTKPIRTLGRTVVILQTLVALGAAVMLAMQFGVRDAAEDFVRNGDLSEFDDDVAPYLAVSLLVAALGIAALVLLIVWSYRIASNLQARGALLTWKPGLTIVAWLLAGCTFNILPFLMLQEHWRRSDTSDDRTSPLIVTWFVVTLAAVALGLIAGFRNVGGFRFGDNEDLAETFADNLTLSLASSAASVAAAVVLIMVVRQLTERHANFNAEPSS